MDVLNFGVVFAAGLLTFFSPCILPVIPVFISTLMSSVDQGADPSVNAAAGEGEIPPLPADGEADTKETADTEAGEKKKKRKGLRIGKLVIQGKPLIRVTLFVLGLSTSFVILGLAFGAIGGFVNQNRQLLLMICGIIVILFGIYQTGIIKIPFLMREKKLTAKKERKGLLGAYILGFTFSFGWTPCVGPILGSVLALTATQGGVLEGGLYMVIYSLGLLVPFLVITLFSNVLLSKIRNLYKHMNKIKIVGGILLVIMGIFLLTDSLHLFS